MTDQELTAAIHLVRDRARANAPQGALGPEGVAATNLMPLVHARDAADAKVAAIGTVNPRPGGVLNSLAQSAKRMISRALDWHVREQVEFNRGAMECVQASIEAFNSVNRSMAALSARHEELRREFDAVKEQAQLMSDSRAEFENRFVAGEIRVLRTISELQAAYSHRLTVVEGSFHESMRAQHKGFEASIDRRAIEIQKTLWEDLAKVREEFERVIHNELRVMRQRPLTAAPAAVASSSDEIPVDWLAFGDRFRGSEERIRSQQGRYIERFAGTVGEILDIGCGRGEFLEAARAAGLLARGIDLSQESVNVCRAKGLDADRADLFAYIEALPDRSVAGLYCSQVVEHLTPPAVARFIDLLGRKLRTGALAAFETPNPECLAIFATHFYIDPTHTRPVPATLLAYYLKEAGFGTIEVEYLEPAVDSIPELAELPTGIRNRFFGGLDYSIFGRKL
ncbi:MAG: methyltransferase domain-containing protein [Bryobacteraceae bacterium]